MCQDCAKKKAAAAAATGQSLDALKAEFSDMFADERLPAMEPEYPDFLYTVRDYERADGTISPAIYPCNGCGALVDHANEICGCWERLDVPRPHEQAAKRMQVSQWLAEYNNRLIASGRLVVWADVWRYTSGLPEAERKAVVLGHSFRAPSAAE